MAAFGAERRTILGAPNFTSRTKNISAVYRCRSMWFRSMPWFLAWNLCSRPRTAMRPSWCPNWIRSASNTTRIAAEWKSRWTLRRPFIGMMAFAATIAAMWPAWWLTYRTRPFGGHFTICIKVTEAQPMQTHSHTPLRWPYLLVYYANVVCDILFGPSYRTFIERITIECIPFTDTVRVW